MASARQGKSIAAAMVLAILFPGAGQLYAGTYWKAPIIWVLAAILWTWVFMGGGGFVLLIPYFLGGAYFIWDAGDDAKQYNIKHGLVRC